MGLELRSRGCDLCGKEPNDTETFAIDHCHGTGRVRGVLCRQCNTALGAFGDSPERLQRALWYLTRPADYRDVT
ncbi:endonuclease domain-containing protein [Streptomyces sp. NPDC050703]|uniref:endonuclease domain-containing protein n=1 Tax=Streptomyces sp. NPDC050703 TaxID=3157218 RepID=UPI0034355C23